jgi:hypothetical protein
LADSRPDSVKPARRLENQSFKFPADPFIKQVRLAVRRATHQEISRA